MFIEVCKKHEKLRKHQGYIYMVKINEYIKIGVTKQPIVRFAAYRSTYKPCTFKVLACALCENYRAIENEVVYHYKEYVQMGRE